MTQLQNGQTVTVAYTAKLEDGTVFDATEEQQPLQFTMGEANLIPGFEQAVRTMSPGEEKTVTIPPDKGFGERLEQNIVTLKPEQIPDDIDVEVGQRLELRQQDGGTVPVTVTHVSEEQVTLDGNHPLAGQTLVFEIKLLQVG